MCTAVLLRRPDHSWPLLFAGNRDEMKDRPWMRPGKHWADREDVFGGLDASAGGSWLAINRHGVLSTVLNRLRSLGPARGKRSRGELVLEALDHPDAKSAAEALSHLDPLAYRSFNLLVADAEEAYWLRNLGQSRRAGIDVFEIPRGVSMVTAFDLNDPKSPRISRNLSLFEHADPPDPTLDDWQSWIEILGSRTYDDPHASMTMVMPGGFETVSSSLVALPSPRSTFADEPERPRWLFAPGRPDLYAYEPVEVRF